MKAKQPMKYQWKITSLKAKDDLILQATYECKVQHGEHFVATEGRWFFKDPKMNVPFREVTEAMVIDWIKEQSEGGIEKRLAEQIASLEEDLDVAPPWQPQVFIPTFKD